VKGDQHSSALVQSAEFGWGYIIGTRGQPAVIDTNSLAIQAPADWTEAINGGDDLEPTSLYVDQRAKRLASPNY
jgi:hypothetical protein